MKSKALVLSVFAFSILGACNFGKPSGDTQAELSLEDKGLTANLSSVAIKSVQASHNDAEAIKSIDGNDDSHWTTTERSASLTFTLSESASLKELQLKVNPNFGTYTIDVSSDGMSWTNIVQSRTNSSWDPASLTIDAKQVSFIRLNLSVTAVEGMIFELRAFRENASQANVIGNVVAGARLIIDTSKVLHNANSNVLGTNRNHVADAISFKQADAKLQKVKELTPTWGQKKYLYRIGHGPTDGRFDGKDYTGYFFEKMWNKLGPYPYDDIREGLKEAMKMGTDQMHVINFGTGSAEQAGRYVSYLNKASDANRAQYPFDQQNVQLFELGNEISWSMVRGYKEHASHETVYARRAKQFAQEMRKNSDVPIKIGAVATTNSNWKGEGWSGDDVTVKNILNIMGTDVDFLIFHGYPSWPVIHPDDIKLYGKKSAGEQLEIRKAMMAQNEWSRNHIQTKINPAIREAAAGRDVRIANTEFFTHLYHDIKRARGMFGALYSADSVVLALNENFLSAVQFCMDHRNLGERSDMADASFFINDDPNQLTTIYKWQKLLAQNFGDQIVEARGVGIPLVDVYGTVDVNYAGTKRKTYLPTPRLAYSASVKENKVYVLVVNRWYDADVKTEIDVGFTPSSVRAHVLSGTADWDSDNGEISTEENVSLQGYAFKKASVTVLEITR